MPFDAEKMLAFDAEKMLAQALCGALKLVLLRIAKPMQKQDWLDLAELLETQAETIRQAVES